MKDIKDIIAEVQVEGLHEDGWQWGHEGGRWGWKRQFGNVVIVTDANAAMWLVTWAETGVFPTDD